MVLRNTKLPTFASTNCFTSNIWVRNSSFRRGPCGLHKRLFALAMTPGLQQPTIDCVLLLGSRVRVFGCNSLLSVQWIPTRHFASSMLGAFSLALSVAGLASRVASRSSTRTLRTIGRATCTPSVTTPPLQCAHVGRKRSHHGHPTGGACDSW